MFFGQENIDHFDETSKVEINETSEFLFYFYDHHHQHRQHPSTTTQATKSRQFLFIYPAKKNFFWLTSSSNHQVWLFSNQIYKKKKK